MIITAASPPPTDPSDCGSPGGPGLSTQVFHITPSTGASVTVTDSGGCELEVLVSGTLYSATDVDCVLPPEAPLSMLAVRSRHYPLFRLDLGGGRFTETSATLRDTNTGPERDCVVGEGRIASIQ